MGATNLLAVLLRGVALAVLLRASVPKSIQAGFQETLGFGPTCASDRTENWKNKQDSGGGEGV